MQQNELIMPEEAKRDSASLEILRLWIVSDRQYVSLRSSVWPDPAAWGIMLADVARHIANSYHQDSGFDPNKSLQRIKARFDAEMASPTDLPGGQIIT